MYNLIVSASPWPPMTNSYSLSRVLELYDDRTERRFRNNNQTPNFESLKAMPCLFMTEGRDQEFAKVGGVSNVAINGDRIELTYWFDQEIPPIPNATIFANQAKFGINGNFEFSRTRWTVKETDLFLTILRISLPRRASPTVFRLSASAQVDPLQISVMMPFSAAFDAVYEQIKSTTENNGFRCDRADEIWNNHAVMQDIVELIDRSTVVIADCTERNPNVFYEMGIAHALGRDVIPVTQSRNDIPFDISHLRNIEYHNNAEGLAELGSKLSVRLQQFTT